MGSPELLLNPGTFQQQDKIEIYTNDETPDFELRTTLQIDQEDFIDLAIGDVTGDGHLDVAYLGDSSIFDSRLYVLAGGGDLSFGEPVEVLPPSELASRVEVTQLNADCRLDLVTVSGLNGADFAVYESLGGGAFLPPIRRLLPGLPSARRSLRSRRERSSLPLLDDVDRERDRTRSVRLLRRSAAAGDLPSHRSKWQLPGDGSRHGDGADSEWRLHLCSPGSTRGRVPYREGVVPVLMSG